MIQSQNKRTLPLGDIVDWPTYQIRGFFLDDARKFFPVSFLQDYARFMGWFKLNTFHLHLNDNDFLANATDPTCTLINEFMVAKLPVSRQREY